jgi:glutamine synthetase
MVGFDAFRPIFSENSTPPYRFQPIVRKKLGKIFHSPNPKFIFATVHQNPFFTNQKAIIMSSIRFQSIETVLQRTGVRVELPSNRISEFFGSNVFNEETMRKFLSEDAYLSVMASINSGETIDRKVADQVASAMKEWAISKGATSFTHWFQPLTGATAEKHDTFFTPSGHGKGIENFNGDALIQQEPDASSFPSGGIRSTFEARGYTAWDPSSPAFIMEIGNGKTLCIPTIFISYTGDSLDYKAPLLKTQHFLEHAAVAVCQCFDKNITKVVPTLGWEQEYFLVDEALYYARPDLMMSGRTLLGHAPAKGQQLEDHYFGSIPERVYAYMLDLEIEAHKLGIPIRTRHNEVAPSQFECAPMFEEANIAVDHNSLLMDLMDRVAKRHKLRVLLHEKPYKGINGSGKHCNWSMGTNTGKNLLSPGRTPKNNLMFLTFFVNTIKAVKENANLLRAAIASAGNDHRLGANEAPPAIISVFIGKSLTEVLNDVVSDVSKKNFDEYEKQELKLKIHNKLPEIMLDNTDRNRTSPFAFTGNKFEFRAVGSSANCASAMIVLNAIVGHQLLQFKSEVDALKEKGDTKDAAILKVLKQYIETSRNILFEGDNYSDEWAVEAEKLGLENVKTTPEALDFYVTAEAKKIFVDHGIFNEVELHARHEIELEKYIKKLQIEGRIIGDLCINHLLPGAIRYQNDLLANIAGLKAAGLKTGSYTAQKQLLEEISTHVNGMKSAVDEMVEQRKIANEMSDAHEKALAYCHRVKPHFDTIRMHADNLEQLVDDHYWTLPKYRELLFIR